jgi:predicted nucleotide-binding protein
VAKSNVKNIQLEPTKRASLRFSRAETESKLNERIELGKKLQESKINSEKELDRMRAEQKKWHEYNIEYLSQCFDVSSIAEDYAKQYGYGPMNFLNDSTQDYIDGFREGVGEQITELESIVERLELIPELNVSEATRLVPSERDRNTVFIVHGHDDVEKIKVARFIEKLGLEAIILHEQANEGKTIIEKFEAHALNVGFAVVLLTPDDVGASKGAQEKLNPRARQNAILELGYFCGSLGRNRVCVLYKEGVEMPSDYLGVIYTPLDNSDGWHLKLAKEMKAAGLDVDMNKAI